MDATVIVLAWPWEEVEDTKEKAMACFNELVKAKDRSPYQFNLMVSNGSGIRGTVLICDFNHEDAIVPSCSGNDVTNWLREQILDEDICFQDDEYYRYIAWAPLTTLNSEFFYKIM